jgi:predicted transposase YbfD/YdcC
LTRCADSAQKPARKITTEYLLTSRSPEQMSPQQMLAMDRRYWGIETGLHLRLDVIAREDCSRVRLPTAALNLAMMRRAVISCAIHWIQSCRHRRKATLSGFYDFMRAHQSKKAFSLLTVCHSSWLPKS